MYSVEQPLSGSPRGAVAHSIHSFLLIQLLCTSTCIGRASLLLVDPQPESCQISPFCPTLSCGLLARKRSKDLKDSLAWQFGNGMLIAPISSRSKRKGA